MIQTAMLPTNVTGAPEFTVTAAENLLFLARFSQRKTSKSPYASEAFLLIDYNTVSIPQKHVECWQFDCK